mgnify:CR=1 FL=1
MYKLILSKPSGYARGLFCAEKIYVNGDSRADATDTKLIHYSIKQKNCFIDAWML